MHFKLPGPTTSINSTGRHFKALTAGLYLRGGGTTDVRGDLIERAIQGIVLAGEGSLSNHRQFFAPIPLKALQSRRRHGIGQEWLGTPRASGSLATPDSITLRTGEASIQFAMPPAGAIETIANVQYGLDQLTLHLAGAPHIVLSAYDPTVNGVHAIALTSSADLTHGVVLTALSSGLTAADVMASNVTLSGRQDTIT